MRWSRRFISSGVVRLAPRLACFPFYVFSLRVCLSACQLGVPAGMQVSRDEFNFFLDLLGSVASCISSDHTLEMKGSAFWALFGSLTEIEVSYGRALNHELYSYAIHCRG